MGNPIVEKPVHRYDDDSVYSHCSDQICSRWEKRYPYCNCRKIPCVKCCLERFPYCRYCDDKKPK